MRIHTPFTLLPAEHHLHWKRSKQSESWAVCHYASLHMSHENSHTLHVIEWQRPLLSLQTCNTWSDSCGSHLACSGVNSQVSLTPDEVIFWQAVAATEPSGPQWETGHPTFPPITHPPPFYPLPLSVQLIILECKLGPKSCSFAPSFIFFSFSWNRSMLFLGNIAVATVTWSWFSDHLGMKAVETQYSKHVFVTLSAKQPTIYLM